MNRLPLRMIAIFGGLTVLAGVATWLLKDAQTAVDAGLDGTWLLIQILPLLLLGFFIAVGLQILIPRRDLSRWIGEASGMRGLLIGTAVGAVTPGGPFTAFPLVIAIHRLGADVGVMVAFLMGWCVIGLFRVFMWEVPLVGPDFALVRTLISLPLPIVAGLAARGLARAFHVRVWPEGKSR